MPTLKDTKPRISLVDEAKKQIANHLNSGAVAIDATAGNGHDTLFLAEQVGAGGKVFSFDIQAQALSNTRLKLQQHSLDQRVRLIHAGHQHWRDYIPSDYLGKVSAIMFNFGYLPGGDKTITTVVDTTLAALNQAPLLLAPSGACMTLMTYPGHEQGKLELIAIEHWLQTLDNKRFQLHTMSLENTRLPGPKLLIVKTRRQCSELQNKL